MKKIFSIVFFLLMAIATFNIFSAMALPISDGTSAAGIVPVSHSGNINPATVSGQFQFKWDSPDTSEHSQIVDIVIPGTTDHVGGTIHYCAADGKQLTWWLTGLSSDDPDYQLIVKWIAVKGGDNYNMYTYPSTFAFTVSVEGSLFTGDRLLLSPPNNGNNTPDISHVVFCLTYRETSQESSSSSSSQSSSSSSESSSSSSSSSSSASSSSSCESSSSSSQSMSSEPSSSPSSTTTVSEDPTPLTNTSDNNIISLYTGILVVSGTMLFVLNKARRKS